MRCESVISTVMTGREGPKTVEMMMMKGIMILYKENDNEVYHDAKY